MLPRGPLREPLSALRFAAAIGVVDGPLSEEDEDCIERFAGSARRFAGAPPAARAAPACREESCAPPESLSGARVGLLAAIARPDSLRRTLAALGAEVVAERTFRDHHRFRPRDLAGLAKQAPLWITTEKDAVKLLPSWTEGARVLALVIEFEVEQPEALLDWIEARLRRLEL